jgi:hypothetical protein
MIRIGHRRDALVLVQRHRLHGLVVRPAVEQPGIHRPHRALDLEEGAVEGASRAVGKDVSYPFRPIRSTLNTHA